MCAFGGVGAYFERLPACDSVYDSVYACVERLILCAMSHARINTRKPRRYERGSLETHKNLTLCTWRI